MRRAQALAAAITCARLGVRMEPGGAIVLMVKRHRPPGLGSSQEPFDRWFREIAREIHGIDLEQGFPPPEQMAADDRVSLLLGISKER
jgi:hypothetical protein